VTQNLETVPVPCSILRGGTSRGVFFSASDLPTERPAIAKILTNVLGSPDARQINGLGGATPQTSKVAIISKSDHPEADVDYLFAQVDITSDLVDWGGNCGNISSAVGPYAINSGLVAANSDGSVTTVRINNVNTGKIIDAQVPVSGTRAAISGDTYIAGFSLPGPRIELDFKSPTGAVTGKTLPTGNLKDRVTLKDGRDIEISVVDAANPTVFVKASSLGMTGLELPQEIESSPEILAVVEEIRSQVAVWMGLVEKAEFAASQSPGLPKIGLMTAATDYVTSDGKSVSKSQVELVVRMFSIRTPHKACQITAGICTSVASLLPGTIVSDLMEVKASSTGRTEIRLGHPSGIMETVVHHAPGDATEILKVSVVRTARAIMDGVVHVPAELFKVTTR
jgi:2-methylaconitate cis-trans-isomerase PrpF